MCEVSGRTAISCTRAVDPSTERSHSAVRSGRPVAMSLYRKVSARERQRTKSHVHGERPHFGHPSA